MKDKLRELLGELMSACEMIGYATSGNERANHRANRDKIKDEFLAILDAEGNGGAVDEVIAGYSIKWLGLAPGTKLYTHPARSGVVAHVPVHPRSGPLWMDTYAAGTNPDRAKYPVMDLFSRAPAQAAQVDEDVVLRAIEADPSAAAEQFSEPVAQGEVVSDMQLDFSVNFMDGWLHDEREEVLRNWSNVKRKALAAQPRAVPNVLRETLENIVAADPRKWEELSEPEGEFERWAKARARHALAAAPSPGESE